MVFEIRDAIYGDIVLSEDEARILDTYEMQRLRHIRQLGNASLVYPSANHTRFEHCLGTRWLAQKIVRISDLPLKKPERKILYKCALLHDVAEPAFTHATERLSVQGFPTHEQIVNYVLNGVYKEKVLEKKQVDTKFICDVIAKEEREKIKSVLAAGSKSDKPFMQELVRGYIDADGLDYLRRDSFFLGLPYGNYDDRVFSSFRIVQFEGANHVAFRDSNDTTNAIMSILNSRFTLWKAAYLHHAVIMADDMFLEALRSAFSKGIIDQYDVFILGDYELLIKMRQEETVRPLINSLLSRNLFKRAYVIDSKVPSETRKRVESLENNVAEASNMRTQLSEKAGISVDKIHFHFPHPSGWKDFHRILLASDDRKIRTLGEKLPQYISLLKENYEDLWQFMVSGDIRTQALRNKLHDVCAQSFGYRGTFSPKKTFDEIKELEEELVPLIDKLRKEVPSSIAILKTLLNNAKPLTRREIAKELNLKPATVSHYLTLINQKLNDGSERILLAKRIGRLKFWSIDKRLQEVLHNV